MSSQKSKLSNFVGQLFFSCRHIFKSAADQASKDGKTINMTLKEFLNKSGLNFHDPRYVEIQGTHTIGTMPYYSDENGQEFSLSGYLNVQRSEDGFEIKLNCNKVSAKGTPKAKYQNISIELTLPNKPASFDRYGDNIVSIFSDKNKNREVIIKNIRIRAGIFNIKSSMPLSNDVIEDTLSECRKILGTLYMNQKRIHSIEGTDLELKPIK